jgi:secreted PhoX family phosphatase
MHRRTFVAGVFGAGLTAMTGSLWGSAAAAVALPGVGPYGPLSPPDVNGIELPVGFTSRVLARSGQVVPGTSYSWHAAPDGGACFADGAGGWVYVSNSEVAATGGAGALRFDAAGTVTGAYSILSRTERNCAGGATPWNTWLSCEEVTRGYVWETYPFGGTNAVRRPAMGRFKHEAAAVDPVRRCVYLTEDEPDGCFYRFVPTKWPSLSKGRLQVLVGGSGTSGSATWANVPDASAASVATRNQVAGAKRFNGGEGCVYGTDGTDAVWFTTKGDNRVWRVNPAANTFELTYDDSLISGVAPLTGVDNITRSTAGELFVAEDGGNMEICVITALGIVASFLRVNGQSGSEITGPAFSPDGTRLFFSSQRGTSGSGITYEVRGPFSA